MGSLLKIIQLKVKYEHRNRTKISPVCELRSLFPGPDSRPKHNPASAQMHI